MSNIHTESAARLFGIPVSEVTSAQRRRAKTLQFGELYGRDQRSIMTPELEGKLENLRHQYTTAKDISRKILEEFEEVKAYLQTYWIDLIGTIQLGKEEIWLSYQGGDFVQISNGEKIPIAKLTREERIRARLYLDDLIDSMAIDLKKECE